MSRRAPTWRIFTLPLTLGAVTLTGLIAGLVGEGGWDVTAGLLLASPLAVTAWHWRRAP